MVNPMKIMQVKGMVEQFQKNHPRIPGFFNAAAESIEEGSVVEMVVTSPEGKSLRANIRVTQEDMQLLKEIKEMGKNQ